jgi:hypothetical protein
MSSENQEIQVPQIDFSRILPMLKLLRGELDDKQEKQLFQDYGIGQYRLTNKELIYLRGLPEFREYIEGLEVRASLGWTKIHPSQQWAMKQMMTRMGWLNDKGRLTRKGMRLTIPDGTAVTFTTADGPIDVTPEEDAA